MTYRPVCSLAWVCTDRPRVKPCASVVDGNPVEDLVQDAPLGLLQPQSWPFDYPNAPPRTPERPVSVIPELFVSHRAFEPARVRQPREVPVAHAKKGRERPDRRDLRHRPAPSSHRWLRHQPPANPRGRRVARVRRAIPQQQFDEARELARSVGRRAVICREHLARDRPDPARPAIKSTATPVDKRSLVPHAGQEGVRHAPGQIGASARVVHPPMIATLRADCTQSCVPGAASNRTQSRARDALAWSYGCPRGSPGEGSAPKGRLCPPRSRNAAAQDGTGREVDRAQDFEPPQVADYDRGGELVQHGNRKSGHRRADRVPTHRHRDQTVSCSSSTISGRGLTIASLNTSTPRWKSVGR